MKKQFFLEHKALFITLSIILVLIIGVISAAAVMLTDKKIYSGVYVSDVSIGGMTREDAASTIADAFQGALEGSVQLSTELLNTEVSLPELFATLKAEEIVEKAHEIGRDGNPFERLGKIFSLRRTPVVLAPVISCDEALLTAKLQEVTAGIENTGEETKTELVDAELIVTRGVPGEGIDMEKSLKRFCETALTLDSKAFTLKPENIEPKEPTGKELYEMFHAEAKNAEYKVENLRLSITPEILGVDFDESVAQNILNQNTDRVVKIPVSLTQPEITAETINNAMFGDLLGSFSSRYNTGDRSRSHNVRLASQNINDVVLAPGDIFSYNDIVGPRTTARGFKSANVYVGNKVEPGIGGGICQVSSTLYNAVIYADLNIVTRTNHSLPVSYVPMGRDATVSYGSIDFKFSNNTGHPIKVVASAEGGVNKISIYGTKENPARTIEIVTECIGTRPAPVTQKEDPTLPVGTVKVEQAGAIGSTYNAYKITKENGSVVKREFLAKSTYVPSDRIEIVGTMPVPSATPTPDVPVDAPVALPTETPIPEATPAPTDAPVLPEIVPPNAGETPAPSPTPAP